jgi:hypothetical protein
MDLLCPEGDCEIVVGVPAGGRPGRVASPPGPARPEIPCNGALDRLDCFPDDPSKSYCIDTSISMEPVE